MSYTSEIYDRVVAQNPGEPEFHQAVKEVLDSLKVVIDANEELYRKESILERFEELDEIAQIALKNRQDIKKINEEMLSNFQKVGILRYNAFDEMGGKLSFALTLLDGENNGYIINSMHSREGCYNYIKEIVKGASYIELSEEESESLERAIYKETLGFDLENMK